MLSTPCSSWPFFFIECRCIKPLTLLNELKNIYPVKSIHRVYKDWMWWWQSGCRGVPWASRPVRILSRHSRFHSQDGVELGGWCCKVIATRFVLVLNGHLACLVNALLCPEASYRNRTQDAPAAASAICPCVRGSYWGEISHLFVFSQICVSGDNEG